jgi:hypothetical protein
MTKLKNQSLEEIQQQLYQIYDGNAGEIIYGLMECGLRGNKLKAALIGYIERATQETSTNL